MLSQIYTTYIIPTDDEKQSLLYGIFQPQKSKELGFEPRDDGYNVYNNYENVSIQ